MKTVVNLETKDARTIIAKFLEIPIENVVPQRYGFGITGKPANEIARKIYGDDPEEDDGK